MRPVRWALSLLTTTIALYVFFFVPIGARTLYDHVKRIAATPEAQDLGRDVAHAGERVGTKIRAELRQGLMLDRDGGVRRPDVASDDAPVPARDAGMRARPPARRAVPARR
jgi:hypothetical protein